MRKIFDSKAGATFHETFPKITMCVKKECIELIALGEAVDASHKGYLGQFSYYRRKCFAVTITHIA